MIVLNLSYGTASISRLVLVVFVSLLATACVQIPVYIEPIGEETAILVINNKTMGTDMYSFNIYEDSEGCKGRSQYNPKIISSGSDTSIRKQVSFKIPARNKFTFNIGAYLDSSTRLCHMLASFDAKKGKKYIMTLKNRGYCSIKLAEETKAGKKLVPIKLHVPRLNEYGGRIPCE